MGSPSLLVWQPPPKPAQSAFPAVGPATRAPVALSKTAKEEFTHCTYWVAPIAPLVSGGAEFTVKPGKPEPTPSKPRFSVGASGDVAALNGPATVVLCSTWSGISAGLSPEGN